MPLATVEGTSAWRFAQPRLVFFGQRMAIYAKVGVACALVLPLLQLFWIIDDYRILYYLLFTALAVFLLWAYIIDFETQTQDLTDELSVARASAASELKEVIAGYAARLPNWDGADGIAPPPDAIADALTFVDSVPESIPLPDKVFAPGDGEVMFQWHESHHFIEIGFYGDDTISWYARSADKQPAYGDDLFDRKNGRKIPEALVRELAAIG